MTNLTIWTQVSTQPFTATATTINLFLQASLNGGQLGGNRTTLVDAIQIDQVIPMTSQIHGLKYDDATGPLGQRDPGDPPLAGVTIYLDLDGNGKREQNEPTSVTDVNGEF